MSLAVIYTKFFTVHAYLFSKFSVFVAQPNFGAARTSPLAPHMTRIHFAHLKLMAIPPSLSDSFG